MGNEARCKVSPLMIVITNVNRLLSKYDMSTMVNNKARMVSCLSSDIVGWV